jgi:hypothetical protein
MTNKRSKPSPISANRKGIRCIIAGSCLMSLGLVMAIVGARVFVLPAMPARPVYLLGAVCFYGYLPAGVAGVVLLVVGLVRRHERAKETEHSR